MLGRWLSLCLAFTWFLGIWTRVLHVCTVSTLLKASAQFPAFDLCTCVCSSLDLEAGGGYNALIKAVCGGLTPSLQPLAEVPFFGSVVLAEVTGILPLSLLTVWCCGVLLALGDCLPKDLWHLWLLLSWVLCTVELHMEVVFFRVVLKGWGKLQIRRSLLPAILMYYAVFPASEGKPVITARNPSFRFK